MTKWTEQKRRNLNLYVHSGGFLIVFVFLERDASLFFVLSESRRAVSDLQ